MTVSFICDGKIGQVPLFPACLSLEDADPDDQPRQSGGVRQSHTSHIKETVIIPVGSGAPDDIPDDNYDGDKWIKSEVTLNSGSDRLGGTVSFTMRTAKPQSSLQRSYSDQYQDATGPILQRHGTVLRSPTARSVIIWIYAGV